MLFSHILAVVHGRRTVKCIAITVHKVAFRIEIHDRLSLVHEKSLY